MRNVTFVAVAMIALGGALPAAAGERASATLASPMANSRKAIIDGRLWNCQAEKCTSGSQGKNQPIVRECARTAKVLGEIVAYRRGERTLDATEITACNASQQAARTATGTDVAANAR